MSQSFPPPPSPSAPPVPLPPEATRALAALFGEGRVVVHRPYFAKLFGGAACGILLSQFWFWTGTPTVQARTGGWFWKPQREITEETGLSRAETATARRRLRAQGILEEERRGIPATLYFRVDTNVVMHLLWAHLKAQEAANKCAEAPQTCSHETRTHVCGDVTNKFARFAHSTSERTSEIISEDRITQTRARPVLPSAFADRGADRGAALSTVQQAVNRGGAAQFRAALAAAPGRAPPERGGGRRAR